MLKDYVFDALYRDGKWHACNVTAENHSDAWNLACEEAKRWGDAHCIPGYQAFDLECVVDGLPHY